MATTRKRFRLENPMIDSRTAGWMLIVVGVALTIYVVSMLFAVWNLRPVDLVTLIIAIFGLGIIALYTSAMLAVLPVLFERDKGDGSSSRISGIPNRFWA